MGPLVATTLLAACGTQPVHAAARSAPPASAPTVTPAPTSPPPTPTSPPPRPVRVVGLGDSVTSGEHCACDDYVTGFGHLLQARDGVRVHVTNDGESGSTSDGLARDLRTEDDLRADVGRADVVVVTTGANDLAPALAAWRSGGCPRSCSDPEIATMRVDLGRVLDTVDRLDGARGRVLVTTYWNVFTDGDVARKAERPGYLAWSDSVTRRANVAITQVAAAHGATLVDLYAPFKGDGGDDPTGLLARDGDHPDAAGTALISRTVLTAYEAGR
ncbi:MAG: SGNH/GDSL hydrolase family protein [Janthinobacterium lividum]